MQCLIVYLTVFIFHMRTARYQLRKMSVKQILLSVYILQIKVHFYFINCRVLCSWNNIKIAELLFTVAVCIIPCSFCDLPCTSMACSCLILVHGSLRTTSHIYSPVSVFRTLATCKDPFVHNLTRSEIASFAADSLYAISSVSLYHRILSGIPPVSSVPTYYANTTTPLKISSRLCKSVYFHSLRT